MHIITALNVETLALVSKRNPSWTANF